MLHDLLKYKLPKLSFNCVTPFCSLVFTKIYDNLEKINHCLFKQLFALDFLPGLHLGSIASSMYCVGISVKRWLAAKAIMW
ncbi:hypothetical protein BpHYR1_023731 [Brachionus plicatilis]|uniref:Uncharacterized protein n=1 Tax=Brachionus plicatilis TaxID=10195 RepID=A0A3M7RTA5_BRAPC|nr:hypothetical protein BpHYR1_023731 [Brachionus plicatilis]